MPTKRFEIAEADRAQVIDGLEIRLPVTLHEGEDVLYGMMRLYYCEAVNKSLCLINQIGIEVPVTVRRGGWWQRERLSSSALSSRGD